MNASGHPFQIRVANGGAAYSDGVTNNGSQTGNVVFNVQHDAPAQLFYQCTSHGSMVGNIYIVGGPQVISGVVTATTFVGNLTGNVTGTASANAVLTGSTNNTLVTVTGANAITGEANLTFNGGATGDAQLTVHAEQNDSGADSELILETSNDFATSVVMFKDSTAEAGSIAYNHGDNYIKLSTNGTNGGTERLRIDSSGRVLIGTTTEGEGTADDLTIATSGTTGITIRSGTSGEGNIFFSDGTSGAAEYAGTIQYSHASNYMLFFTGAAERLRITSTGEIKQYGFTGSSDAGTDDLVLGNTTGGVNRGITIWSNSSQNGSIAFADNDSNFRGAVQYLHNGDIMRLLTAGNERIRINSSGQVGIGRDTDPLNGVKLMVQNGSNNVFYAYHEGTGNNYSILCRNDRAVGSTQATQIIFIGSGNVAVGDIRSTGSGTAYNTSSDYRLKENVTAISDGITRLKTLKPSRFNFKVDKDTTVDGFLAHEVTAVPEAISGTKDEVVTQAMIDNGDAPSDSKLNDPIYQQIDQAKLVPLLTAALQEAITKIETLEAKVSALEGS